MTGVRLSNGAEAGMKSNASCVLAETAEMSRSVH
jgi:hypothetical protein